MNWLKMHPGCSLHAHGGRRDVGRRCVDMTYIEFESGLSEMCLAGRTPQQSVRTRPLCRWGCGTCAWWTRTATCTASSPAATSTPPLATVPGAATRSPPAPNPHRRRVLHRCLARHFTPAYCPTPGRSMKSGLPCARAYYNWCFWHSTDDTSIFCMGTCKQQTAFHIGILLIWPCCGYFRPRSGLRRVFCGAVACRAPLA